jgi:hypothetical protein
MGRSRFDDLFARLSRQERVAFVGALLAARGWDVDVDPPVVRVTREGKSKVVAVAREALVRGPGLPRTSVDVVVGVDAARTERLATERDARAWDAHTLYDMARHGLDPAATDRLFGDYFGQSSEEVERPTAPGGVGADSEEHGATVPSSEGRRGADVAQSDTAATSPVDGRRRWLVPLLVVVLLVAGGFTAQALIGMPPADATTDGASAGDGTAVGGNSGDDAPPTAASTATPVPELQPAVPGLSTSGVIDTAVLARGHAAALTNRSFTMRITYAEQVDGETVGRAQEVVRVENRTTYRSTGVRSGNLTSALQPIIVRDLYADGDGRYLRQGGGALRVGGADDPGTGQVVERSRALVAWYLSANDSTLVGRTRTADTLYYRVGVEGTSDPRAEQYRASGLVSEEGLVVRVDAFYRLPGTDRTATVSLRHVDVDNTTVARPGWMPLRNESAG